jgi:DNA-directed RNA polymerase specialized sigma24 family protein
MAFGAALALLSDFHQTEDVVQEAFVAAWSARPSLADPAAFPGWLHGIVRHQEVRGLRKRTPRTVPLAEGEGLPCEEALAARRLEQRRQSAMAAIAGLPGKLASDAVLYPRLSLQHIAVLGLPVATVNNQRQSGRLRDARSANCRRASP